MCLQLGEKAVSGSTSTTFQIAETGQFKATLVPDPTNSLYNVPTGRSVTLKAVKRDGMSLEATYLGLPV
ncbi:hypothetical protein MEO41_29035, partial [Dolichospermum sp. ST_sed4]|nr:hypothetical protein [Dolichospermum sp. ST_sed4]